MLKSTKKETSYTTTQEHIFQLTLGLRAQAWELHIAPQRMVAYIICLQIYSAACLVSQ